MRRMDERCRRFHADLISGICPWCGGAVINGQVPDAFATFDPDAIDFTTTDCEVEFLQSKSNCQSLYQIAIANGRLDFRVALQFTLEVAHQLASIHDTAGYHGAVRPENIFADEDGEVTLGATGLAHIRSMPKDSVLEEMVERSGIADYLAPEQALNSFVPDPRSDIYSLGCTLYFLLVGAPPFADGSISERLLKHQTTTPTPVDQLRPDVPVELARICAKMLAKKPADRYQTAVEVAAALTGME